MNHHNRRRSILEKIARKSMEVRSLQKEYFKNRSPGILNECRAKERELDLLHDELRSVEAYIKGERPAQAGLFD